MPAAVMTTEGVDVCDASTAGAGLDERIPQCPEEVLQDWDLIYRELSLALATNQLDLHFQPIVSAAPARTVGVEALLRWRHPEYGQIPPGFFVPVAEQSGLMEQLGEFALRRALADAARWPNLYVAVNVSPVQMRNPAFVDLVRAVLAETGVPSSRVLLEVTEGVFVDNPDETKQRIEHLRDLGVRVALDDFGTGYSSLGYLQHLPFDKLKIDRSFVSSMGTTRNGTAIIHAIVALGRALGMGVLAEGVEKHEQRVLLRLAGCDEMQGFLFAKPMPREGIDALSAKAEARDRRAAAMTIDSEEGRIAG